jgi:energy-coupling factor transporter ATP-binding protein EcfA2
MPDGLSLGRMMRHAARLRLARGTSRAEVALAADDAVASVGLDDHDATLVGRLSGGQRRRASIAMELVTHPDACVLDEPTSGLDPRTGDDVVDRMRSLADAGGTVVFTTHHAGDLVRCDRVVALAPGGRVVFDGSVEDAMALTGTSGADRLHRALVDADEPIGSIAPTGIEARPEIGSRASSLRPERPARVRRAHPIVQWWTLTVRTIEGIARNRLTLAIMLGSPAMVVAMFAVLFRPGAFDPADPSPTAAVMIAFWVAFGGFFFGLTYGLLQICPELELIRREHRAGVPASLQLLAKLAALTPVLLVIDVVMLAVLRALDRLPAIDGPAMTRIGVTLALDAIAALALGLLASSAVSTPAQASLALPMLCFPAVLFSGAVLPVPVMATAGRAVSALMSDRWAFEAIGADLGLRRLFAEDPSGVGPALLDQFGGTWNGDVADQWTRLVGFAVVLTVAGAAVLHRRTRPR